MKIRHFCNSFIFVEIGSTRIVCDPWVGIANYGGWISYPISTNTVKKAIDLKEDKKLGSKILQSLNPTHIYISHLHSDHLDSEILMDFPDKEIKVIINDFNNKLLHKRVSSLGFKNVIELDPWKFIDLSDDIEIAVLTADLSNSGDFEDEIGFEIDTSILIRSKKNGLTFFNGVDSPFSNEAYRKIFELCTSAKSKNFIDIACLALGAASEYPQCFLGIDREKEKKEIIDNSLKVLTNTLETLNAKAFFPAGGTYLIPGKYSSLNKFVAQPTSKQMKTVVTKILDKKYFDIEGGASLNFEKGQWKKEESMISSRYLNQKSAIEANINLIYKYLDPQVSEVAKTNTSILYAKAKENYFNQLEKKQIQPKWKVIFNLYENMKIDEACNLGACKKVNEFKLQLEKQPIDYELICHMDYQLFDCLLQRKCIWNITLSGSLILFERKPNIFIPTIPFSLNYLVA